MGLDLRCGKQQEIGVGLEHIRSRDTYINWHSESILKIIMGNQEQILPSFVTLENVIHVIQISDIKRGKL